MPLIVRFGQRAAGDNVVDMGMVLQLPAPGLQHTEKSGHVPTDVFGIIRQFFHGIGRCRKQGGVA